MNALDKLAADEGTSESVQASIAATRIRTALLNAVDAGAISQDDYVAAFNGVNDLIRYSGKDVR
jgi:hypothetical protein